MGIEPMGKALPELENKRFRANADAKCDQRVNFRGMWGNVRLRRDTSVSEVPGPLSVVGLRRVRWQPLDLVNQRGQVEPRSGMRRRHETDDSN